MKNNKDEKWLDDTISRAADFGKIKFDAQKWNEKFLSSESHEASRPNVKIKSDKNFWRIIMESKVTRYSAAAVITLAAILILVNPFGNSQYGGVVLADVQQKVADIKTMIIRGTKTFTRPDEPNSTLEFGGIRWEFDLVKYFSQQYGLVEEGYIGDALIYRFTFNRPQRQTLLILPLYKKYGIFASTDKIMRLLENGTPKGIINLLLEIDYKKLGRDNINGVEAEVFAYQDPGTFKELLPKAIADIQNIKGKVWIGIEEEIPVRVEGDLAIGKSFMTMFQELNLHEVNTFGDYNIELDENIFDIAPPEGYTELTLTDILQVIPAEAKAGLVGLGIIPIGLIFWRRHRKNTGTRKNRVPD